MLDNPKEDPGSTENALMCTRVPPESSLEAPPIKQKRGCPQKYTRDEYDKPIATDADGIRITEYHFRAACCSSACTRIDCSLLQLPYYILLQIGDYLVFDKAVFALLGLPVRTATHKNAIIEKEYVSSKPQRGSQPEQENKPERKGKGGRKQIYPRDKNGKPIFFNADGSRTAEKPKYNNAKRIEKARRKKRGDSRDAERDD